MATTVYTLLPTWDSGARYTAGSETAVRLNNPNDNIAISFELTTSDTTPAVDPVNANKILPGDSVTITLATSDRLWVSGSKGYASLVI